MNQFHAGRTCSVWKKQSEGIGPQTWLSQHQWNLMCLKNKLYENGNMIRNKAQLVAQWYTQKEHVNFDETSDPVARFESIKLLLGILFLMKFKLYQIIVKTSFLSGLLNEEVYFKQPKGSIIPSAPYHVYNSKKYLYGLK